MSPWRIALNRERSLPSDVFGPVLLSALRRLAWICLRVLIGLIYACAIRRGFRMGLLPESFGNCERVDIHGFPPCLFITGLVQLPVVPAAEWDRKLVAHFQAEGSRLRVAHMMRIRRLSFADEARL